MLQCNSGYGCRLPDRKPPARDFPVQHTLSVSDYGATPNDGKDDLASIRAAMNKAAAPKVPTALLRPKGTYDLFRPDDPDQDIIYRVSRGCLAFCQLLIDKFFSIPKLNSPSTFHPRVLTRIEVTVHYKKPTNQLKSSELSEIPAHSMSQ